MTKMIQLPVGGENQQLPDLTDKESCSADPFTTTNPQATSTPSGKERESQAKQNTRETVAQKQHSKHRRTSSRRLTSIRNDGVPFSRTSSTSISSPSSSSSASSSSLTLPSAAQLELYTAETSVFKVPSVAESSGSSIICSLPLVRLESILSSLDIIKHCANAEATSLPTDTTMESSASLRSKELRYSSTAPLPSAEVQDDRDDCSPLYKMLCLYCERTFSNQNLMIKHTDRVHKLSKERRSSSRVVSAVHITDVSSSCIFCHKGRSLNPTSEDLPQLFQHLIAVHSDRYYACERCVLRFPCEEAREAHMETLHPAPNGARPKSKAALKAFSYNRSSTSNHSLHHAGSSKGLKRNSSTSVGTESLATPADLGLTQTTICKNHTNDEDGNEEAVTELLETNGQTVRLRSSQRNTAGQQIRECRGDGKTKMKTLVYKKSERLLMRNAEPMLLSRLGITQHRLPRQSRRLLAAASSCTGADTVSTSSTSSLSSYSASSSAVTGRTGSRKKIAALSGLHADDPQQGESCSNKLTKIKTVRSSLNNFSSGVSGDGVDSANQTIDPSNGRSKSLVQSDFTASAATSTSTSVSGISFLQGGIGGSNSRVGTGGYTTTSNTGSGTCSSNIVGNSSNCSSSSNCTNNNGNIASSGVFDEDFYENVARNVHINLSCHLDGKLQTSMPNAPSPMSPIAATPTVRSTVVRSPLTTDSKIHEATNLPAVGVMFPTLLTVEQYGTDAVAGVASVVTSSAVKTKKPITRNSWKWKWDFVKKYKYVNENGRIVKKIKQPTLGLRDLSKLDMWTQLTMRTKHELMRNPPPTIDAARGNSSLSSVNADDRESIAELGAVLRQDKRAMVEQLDHILDARLLPQIDLEQNDQRIIKVEPLFDDQSLAVAEHTLIEGEELNSCVAIDSFASQGSTSTSLVPSTSSSDSNDCSTVARSVTDMGQDFLRRLQLMKLARRTNLMPVVLSGEWARPRCYICYGCGEMFNSLKQVEEHRIFRHPHVYSTFYEIVGRELIEKRLYKHFFIPFTALATHRLHYLRLTAIDGAAPQMYSSYGISNIEIKNEDSSSNEATSFSTTTSASLVSSSRYSTSSSSVTTLATLMNANAGGVASFTRYPAPPLEEDDGSRLVVCSKCQKECQDMLVLYAHMLQCSNDYVWLQAKKRMKYRRARRRKGGNRNNTSGAGAGFGCAASLLATVRKAQQQQQQSAVEKAETASTTSTSSSKADGSSLSSVATNSSSASNRSTSSSSTCGTSHSGSSGTKKKSKSPKPKDSDSDIVKRLLANLPAKRNSRQIILQTTKQISKRSNVKGRKPHVASLTKASTSVALKCRHPIGTAVTTRITGAKEVKKASSESKLPAAEVPCRKMDNVTTSAASDRGSSAVRKGNGKSISVSPTSSADSTTTTTGSTRAVSTPLSLRLRASSRSPPSSSSGISQSSKKTRSTSREHSVSPVGEPVEQMEADGSVSGSTIRKFSKQQSLASPAKVGGKLIQKQAGKLAPEEAKGKKKMRQWKKTTRRLGRIPTNSNRMLRSGGSRDKAVPGRRPQLAAMKAMRAKKSAAIAKRMRRTKNDRVASSPAAVAESVGDGAVPTILREKTPVEGGTFNVQQRGSSNSEDMGQRTDEPDVPNVMNDGKEMDVEQGQPTNCPAETEPLASEVNKVPNADYMVELLERTSSPASIEEGKDVMVDNTGNKRSSNCADMETRSDVQLPFLESEKDIVDNSKLFLTTHVTPNQSVKKPGIKKQPGAPVKNDPSLWDLSDRSDMEFADAATPSSSSMLNHPYGGPSLDSSSRSPVSKRKPKKLNDCIAMLTGKLSERLGVDFFNTQLQRKSSSEPPEIPSTLVAESDPISSSIHPSNPLLTAMPTQVSAAPILGPTLPDSTQVCASRSMVKSPITKPSISPLQQIAFATISVPMPSSTAVPSTKPTQRQSPRLKLDLQNTSQAVPVPLVINTQPQTFETRTLVRPPVAGVSSTSYSALQQEEDVSDEPLNLSKNCPIGRTVPTDAALKEHRNVFKSNLELHQYQQHQQQPSQQQHRQPQQHQQRQSQQHQQQHPQHHPQQQVSVPSSPGCATESHNHRQYHTQQHSSSHLQQHQYSHLAQNSLKQGLPRNTQTDGSMGISCAAINQMQSNTSSCTITPKAGSGNLASIKLPPGLIIERVEYKQSRPIISKEAPSVTIVARQRQVPFHPSLPSGVSAENRKTTSASSGVPGVSSFPPTHSHSLSDPQQSTSLMQSYCSGEQTRKASEGCSSSGSGNAASVSADQQSTNLRVPPTERPTQTVVPFVENRISVTITEAKPPERLQDVRIRPRTNSVSTPGHSLSSQPQPLTAQRNDRALTSFYSTIPKLQHAPLSSVSISPQNSVAKLPPSRQQQLPHKPSSIVGQISAEKPSLTTLIIPHVPMPQQPPQFTTSTKRPRRKSVFVPLPPTGTVSAPNTSAREGKSANSNSPIDVPRTILAPVPSSFPSSADSLSRANMLASMSFSFLPHGLLSGPPLGLDLQRLAAVGLPAHLKPPVIPPLTVPTATSSSAALLEKILQPTRSEVLSSALEQSLKGAQPCPSDHSSSIEAPVSLLAHEKPGSIFVQQCSGSFDGLTVPLEQLQPTNISGSSQGAAWNDEPKPSVAIPASSGKSGRTASSVRSAKRASIGDCQRRALMEQMWNASIVDAMMEKGAMAEDREKIDHHTRAERNTLLLDGSGGKMITEQLQVPVIEKNSSTSKTDVGLSVPRVILPPAHTVDKFLLASDANEQLGATKQKCDTVAPHQQIDLLPDQMQSLRKQRPESHDETVEKQDETEPPHEVAPQQLKRILPQPEQFLPEETGLSPGACEQLGSHEAQTRKENDEKNEWPKSESKNGDSEGNREREQESGKVVAGLPEKDSAMAMVGVDLVGDAALSDSSTLEKCNDDQPMAANVTTTPKVIRKRRKNELASILSDQLLESFKEVDKSRLNDLKLLHDITCETPDVKFTLEQIPQLAKRKSNPRMPELIPQDSPKATAPNCTSKKGTVKKGLKDSATVDEALRQQERENNGATREAVDVSKQCAVAESEHIAALSIKKVEQRDSTVEANAGKDRSTDRKEVVAITDGTKEPLSFVPTRRTRKLSIDIDRLRPVVDKKERIPQKMLSQKNAGLDIAIPKKKKQPVGKSPEGKEVLTKETCSYLPEQDAVDETIKKGVARSKTPFQFGKKNSLPISTEASFERLTKVLNIDAPMESKQSVSNHRKNPKRKHEKQPPTVASEEPVHKTEPSGLMSLSNESNIREAVSQVTKNLPATVSAVAGPPKRERRKSVFVDRNMAKYVERDKEEQDRLLYASVSIKDDQILASRRGTRSQGKMNLNLVDSAVEATMNPRDPRRRIVRKRMEEERAAAAATNKPRNKQEGQQASGQLEKEKTQEKHREPVVVSQLEKKNSAKVCTHPSAAMPIVQPQPMMEEKSPPLRRISTRRASVFVKSPTPPPPSDAVVSSVQLSTESSAAETGRTSAPSREDENLRSISNETKRIYRRRASIYKPPDEMLQQDAEDFEGQEPERKKKGMQQRRSKTPGPGEWNRRNKLPLNGNPEPLIESLLLQAADSDSGQSVNAQNGPKRRTTKNSQIAETVSKLFNIQEEIMLIDSTRRKPRKLNTAPLPSIALPLPQAEQLLGEPAGSAAAAAHRIPATSTVLTSTEKDDVANDEIHPSPSDSSAQAPLPPPALPPPPPRKSISFSNDEDDSPKAISEQVENILNNARDSDTSDDSDDDNMSLACFVAHKHSDGVLRQRGELNTMAQLGEGTVTDMYFPARAMSVADDESTTNTDAMDDDLMSVTTEMAPSTTSMYGGRGRRKRRHSARASKLKRQQAKAKAQAQSEAKQLITYNCDLCRKVFKKQDAYNKHRMTLSHIAKLSEQEYIQSQQLQQQQQQEQKQQEQVQEQQEQEEQKQEEQQQGQQQQQQQQQQQDQQDQLHQQQPQPQRDHHQEQQQLQQHHHHQEDKQQQEHEQLQELQQLQDLSSSIQSLQRERQIQRVEYHDEGTIDPAHQPDATSILAFTQMEDGGGSLVSDRKDLDKHSVKVLSQEEKLFYECCSMLKESNTSEGDKLSLTVSLKTSEIGNTVSIPIMPVEDDDKFGDIQYPISVRRQPSFAGHSVIPIAGSLEAQYTVPADRLSESTKGATGLRDVIQEETSFRAFRDVSDGDGIVQRYSDGGRNGKLNAMETYGNVSPQHSTKSSSTSSCSNAKIKTKGALKGYDNFKVSIPMTGLIMSAGTGGVAPDSGGAGTDIGTTVKESRLDTLADVALCGDIPKEFSVLAQFDHKASEGIDTTGVMCISSAAQTNPVITVSELKVDLSVPVLNLENMETKVKHDGDGAPSQTTDSNVAIAVNDCSAEPSAKNNGSKSRGTRVHKNPSLGRTTMSRKRRKNDVQQNRATATRAAGAAATATRHKVISDRTAPDDDVYAFQDSPSDDALPATYSSKKTSLVHDATMGGRESEQQPQQQQRERQSCAAQKAPNEPAAHGDEDSQVSSLSFSDRDDFVYGTGTMSDEDEEEEEEDRSSSNSSGQTTPKKAMKADVQKKSLIMGRIFKKGGKREKSKENAGVATKTQPLGTSLGPKASVMDPGTGGTAKTVIAKDFDKLFDTLKNAAAEAERDAADRVREQASDKQHTEATCEEPPMEAFGSAVESKLLMYPDYLPRHDPETVNTEPGRLRRRATGRQKKLTETWDSDEYEEFHADDIMGLIDRAADKRNDGETLSNAAGADVKDAKSSVCLPYIVGLSLNAHIERQTEDQVEGIEHRDGVVTPKHSLPLVENKKPSTLDVVVTDDTIRKVMESVILETMAKSNNHKGALTASNNRKSSSNAVGVQASNNKSQKPSNRGSHPTTASGHHSGRPKQKEDVRNENADSTPASLTLSSLNDHVLESSVVISSRTITTKFKQKLNISMRSASSSGDGVIVDGSGSNCTTQTPGVSIKEKSSSAFSDANPANAGSEGASVSLNSLTKNNNNINNNNNSHSNKNNANKVKQSTTANPSQLETSKRKPATRTNGRACKGGPIVASKNAGRGRPPMATTAASSTCKARKSVQRKMKNVAYDPDSDYEHSIKYKKVKRKLLESDIEANLKIEQLKSTLNADILLSTPRRKRNAGDMLYYWSSSSEEEEFSDEGGAKKPYHRARSAVSSKAPVEKKRDSRKKGSEVPEATGGDCLSTRTTDDDDDVAESDARGGFRARDGGQTQPLVVLAHSTEGQPTDRGSLVVVGIPCGSEKRSKPPGGGKSKQYSTNASPNDIDDTTKASFEQVKEGSGAAGKKGRGRKQQQQQPNQGKLATGDDGPADTSSNSDNLQQHGWIVGDSHKKLVTLLAHAKGKQDNRKTTNHRRK